MLLVDRHAAFRFAALQSPAGRALLQRAGRSPDDLSSIVLCEEGSGGLATPAAAAAAGGAAYTKSAAVLRIARGLPAPLPQVAAVLDLLPLPLKDGVYEQV